MYTKAFYIKPLTTPKGCPLLESLYRPIKARVTAQSRAQRRNQHGGARQVVQQVGTLADQQVHLVAVSRDRFVQRDLPHAHGMRQMAVQHPSARPVKPVPLETFTVVAFENL